MPAQDNQVVLPFFGASQCPYLVLSLLVRPLVSCKLSLVLEREQIRGDFVWYYTCSVSENCRLLHVTET